MGWSWTHKPEGVTTTEFLKKELEYDNDKGSLKFVKTCCKLRVFYAQVEHVNKANGKVSRWAAVILVGHAPKSYHNFGWKTQDETCGPYDYECPLSILEGLDPPENEYAKNWREAVLAYNAKRKAAPKNGQWVKFSSPIKFTNGCQYQAFKCVKENRKTYFIPQGESQWCKVKISRRCLMGEGVQVSNEEPSAVEAVSA